MLAWLVLVAGLQPGMVRIAGGEFKPLYAMPGHPVAHVSAFAIDTVSVSQAQFLAFTRQQPRWAIKGMGASTTLPATRVSWSAAAAYCKARGARLPTTYEWEYVARADEKRRDAGGDGSFRQRLLELTMKNRGSNRIGGGLRNIWRVRDLHGGVFEWTHDYNGHLDSSHKHGASMPHCASGTVQTGDPSDYAAFMRYSFRSTADADAGAGNVGFRCAV
ncbi:MAG TPA: formylglycine-generating enzyme family protein [Longimicrobiales bacterium]|nr:formylglycine-generating enzyme family protein [Longimicrobiales bacterium]